jgi:hypothetical protein
MLVQELANEECWEQGVLSWRDRESPKCNVTANETPHPTHHRISKYELCDREAAISFLGPGPYHRGEFEPESRHPERGVSLTRHCKAPNHIS